MLEQWIFVSCIQDDPSFKRHQPQWRSLHETKDMYIDTPAPTRDASCLKNRWTDPNLGEGEAQADLPKQKTVKNQRETGKYQQLTCCCIVPMYQFSTLSFIFVNSSKYFSYLSCICYPMRICYSSVIWEAPVLLSQWMTHGLAKIQLLALRSFKVIWIFVGLCKTNSCEESNSLYSAKFPTFNLAPTFELEPILTFQSTEPWLAQGAEQWLVLINRRGAS